MSDADNAGHRPVKPGSDRAFGVVMAGFFALVAGLRLWHGSPWGWAFGAVALIFGGLAFAAPHMLAPLNRIWFVVGRVLHAVVSPIVFGVVFFGVITPIGLLMRRSGNRPLAPNLDRGAASYWVPRAIETRRPGPMSKQY